MPVPPRPGEANRRVFISGPPGSGKSTVAALVAAKFARSVYIGADLVRESIVGGFEAPTYPVTDGFVQQTVLQREIVIGWAERMALAGYVPVVDDAPIPDPVEFVRQYRPLWDDPRTALVMLRPDADEVRRRIMSRAGPFDEFLVGVVDLALEWIDGLDLTGWNIVDSTGQGPEETAELVFELVE